MRAYLCARPTQLLLDVVLVVAMAPTVGPTSTFAAVCIATFGGLGLWSYTGDVQEAPVQPDTMLAKQRDTLTLLDDSMKLFEDLEATLQKHVQDKKAPVQLDAMLAKQRDTLGRSLVHASRKLVGATLQKQVEHSKGTLDAKSFPSLGVKKSDAAKASAQPPSMAALSSSLLVPRPPLGSDKATLTSMSSSLLVQVHSANESSATPTTIKLPDSSTTAAGVADVLVEPLDIEEVSFTTRTFHMLKTSVVEWASVIMASAVFIDLVLAAVCFLAIHKRQQPLPDLPTAVHVSADADQKEAGEEAPGVTETSAPVVPSTSVDDKTKQEVTTERQPAVPTTTAQPSLESTTENVLKAQINAIVKSRTEQRKQAQEAKKSETPLQAKINKIVKARTEERMQQSPAVSSNEWLQGVEGQMNAIVNARKEMQSPCAKSSPVGSDTELQAQINEILTASTEKKRCRPSPVKAIFCSDVELKDQINDIVGAHAKSLKQQKLMFDPSPSPAKSLSDLDLEYHANVALNQAKARSTPQKSPAASVNWPAWEDEIGTVAPCQLSFGECGDAFETQNDEMPVVPPLPEVTVGAAVTEAKEEPLEAAERSKKFNDVFEPRPFDINEIPSPTRNRAKKEQAALWANATVAVQEASPQVVQQTMAHEAAWNVAVEAGEAVLKDAHAQEQEEAELREKQKKWLRELKAKAEMSEMDRLCVEVFLDSVKTNASSRDRVRTPIKGSNLYTKHMRPIRPPGTSVDVKDSSFLNLANFLGFLETEGLLHLKPGLTDPVVSGIYFEACRNYKYDSQTQARFMAAVRGEAPHEAGCSCRLCVSCNTGRKSL